MRSILFAAIVIIMLMSTISCGLYTWYADMDYFKKEDGIVIGTPVKNNNSTWLLPIEFNTRIMNTAHRNADISVYKKGNIIEIRLLVGLSGGGWTKGAYLGKLQDGVYQVRYLNSDGSTANIGSIYIKN